MGMGNFIGEIGSGFKEELIPSGEEIGKILAENIKIATREIIEFQKELANLNTILKVSQTELNKYGEKFIDLSINTGINKKEVLEEAQHILALGVKKNELLDFLEITVKTATAGQIATNAAAEMLQTINKAYGTSLREVEAIADTLLTIQGKTSISLGMLEESLKAIAAVSGPLGINFDEVGAAMIQFIRNENTASEAASMLKSIFIELSTEGYKAAETFESLSGMTFESFIASGGTLQETLELLKRSAQENNQSLKEMFSSVEAGNAAFLLTGMNSEEFSRHLENMKNNSGEMSAAYTVATANIKDEWDKLLNAMTSHWERFVSFFEKPLYMTIKEVRQLVDGQDNGEENLNETKRKIAEHEKEVQKILAIDNLNNIQKERMMKRHVEIIEKLEKEKRETENKIIEDNYQKNITAYKNYQKNLNKYLKDDYAGQEKEARNYLKTMAKLNDELYKSKNPKTSYSERQELIEEKEIIKERIKFFNEKIEIQEKYQRQQTALKNEEKELLNQHNKTINSAEGEYLKNKKNYIEEQEKLLNMGAISKEEYNKNLEKKDRGLLNIQKNSNVESLKNLEEYYKKVGNLEKIDEYRKKRLKLEIDIKSNTSITTGGDFNDIENTYLEEERKKRKEFQAHILEDEWVYMEQLAALREEGVYTEKATEEIAEETRMRLAERKLQYEEEELEKRLEFYALNNQYSEKYSDTQIALAENKLKQQKNQMEKDKKNRSSKIKWEEWASKYEVDIYARSEGALLSSLDAIMSGQIKSLDDFKKFAQLQLAELLFALGQENAAKAISKTAEAIGYATNPFTVSLAPPAFASAAKFATVAAAFGVAALAISPNESAESNGENSNTNIATKYDEGIEERLETSSQESEGTVMIDVSDSQMSKLWIKQIEKELNDGYNVTLVGKKKI